MTGSGGTSWDTRLVRWKQLQRRASPGPGEDGASASRRGQPAWGSGGRKQLPGSRGEHVKSVATQRLLPSDVEKSERKQTAECFCGLKTLCLVAATERNLLSEEFLGGL
ncbi:uncharacterized protein AAGF69_006433 [Amazona ochrocephala]